MMRNKAICYTDRNDNIVWHNYDEPKLTWLFKEWKYKCKVCGHTYYEPYLAGLDKLIGGKHENNKI